ncbi:MAG: quinolinate synthase NadA, partial [Psychrobacter sp.]
NGLKGIEQCLTQRSGEVLMTPELAAAASKPLQRMLDFAEAQKQQVAASGDIIKDRALFANVGAA